MNSIDGFLPEEVRIELTDRNITHAIAEVISIPLKALMVPCGEELGFFGAAWKYCHVFQNLVQPRRPGPGWPNSDEIGK
jgi:hypothetical protein